MQTKGRWPDDQQKGGQANREIEIHKMNKRTNGQMTHRQLRGTQTDRRKVISQTNEKTKGQVTDRELDRQTERQKYIR